MELLQLFLAIYKCTFLEFHLRGKSNTTSSPVTHNSKIVSVLEVLEVNCFITKLAFVNFVKVFDMACRFHPLYPEELREL